MSVKKLTNLKKIIFLAFLIITLLSLSASAKWTYLNMSCDTLHDFEINISYNSTNYDSNQIYYSINGTGTQNTINLPDINFTTTANFTLGYATIITYVANETDEYYWGINHTFSNLADTSYIIYNNVTNFSTLQIFQLYNPPLLFNRTKVYLEYEVSEVAIAQTCNATFYIDNIYNTTYQLQSAPFGGLGSSATFQFNGYTYIVGGYRYNDSTYRNEVWLINRTDLYNMDYVMINASPLFSGRSGAAAVVYNDIIYMTGGYDGTTHLDEAWLSTDGINWFEAGCDCVSNRSEHFMTAGENGIYLAGGWNVSGYLNDVLYSDGATPFVTRTADANWEPRIAATFYNYTSAGVENLIIIGGWADGAAQTDEWRSVDDGITWTLQASDIGRGFVKGEVTTFCSIFPCIYYSTYPWYTTAQGLLCIYDTTQIWYETFGFEQMICRDGLGDWFSIIDIFGDALDFVWDWLTGIFNMDNFLTYTIKMCWLPWAQPLCIANDAFGVDGWIFATISGNITNETAGGVEECELDVTSVSFDTGSPICVNESIIYTANTNDCELVKIYVDCYGDGKQIQVSPAWVYNPSAACLMYRSVSYDAKVYVYTAEQGLSTAQFFEENGGIVVNDVYPTCNMAGQSGGTVINTAELPPEIGVEGSLDGIFEGLGFRSAASKVFLSLLIMIITAILIGTKLPLPITLIILVIEFIGLIITGLLPIWILFVLLLILSFLTYLKFANGGGGNNQGMGV